jgi:hypothetical protein
VKLAALVLAAALAGCISMPAPSPTLEKPAPVAVEGEFVHAPSGMAFPERIGAFQRVDVKRYDAEGRNVSVGYNLARGPFVLIATAYVYPQPEPSSFLAGEEAVEEWRARLDLRELQANVSAVASAHREDALEETSRGPVSVRSQGGTHEGTRVSWDMVNALGTPRLRGTTHLHLFCRVGDGWIVKFRFTHPRGVDCAPAIDALMSGLRWPGP